MIDLNKNTTIPEDKWGIHKTHCCNKHGCKYGNEDCPVVINLIKQDYPCELCYYENDNYLNLLG